MDPALRARALLAERRLLEAVALADAARYRYERLLVLHPGSARVELAATRLASLAQRRDRTSMKRPASIPGLASAVRDKRAFVAMLHREFAISWHGLHGAAHWARVAHNGRILCRASGANPRVVGLFALLHDLRRRDEGSDPQHGPRAAIFIREIAGEHLLLDREELAQLCDACVGHSEGELSSDPTVAACWDADRLDLGRVGKRPSERFLSLEAARQPALMDGAYRRSIAPLARPR